MDRKETRGESPKLAAMTGIGNVNLTNLAWGTNIVLGGRQRFDIEQPSLAAFCFLIASLAVAVLIYRRPRYADLLGAALLGATFGPAGSVG